MCGIFGFNWSDEILLKSMNTALKHRGPNDEGFYRDKNMSLGQVRLSIVDLSEKGHQPMGIKIGSGNKIQLIYKDPELINADIIIVFNGEIYNYQEIQKELVNYSFESTCDTEVILKAYMEWGVDCVKKFNGMWAFCIYDLKKKLLFCSRDRFGVKPFYYYQNNYRFIFGSELKAILEHTDLRINTSKNLNQNAMDLYFSLGFIPSPYSIFNNIYKLEGSHNLTYDLNTQTITKIWKYYELPDYKPNYNKKALMKEIEEEFLNAVKIRLISDVPVGVFLSGGLDSSSVVSTLRNIVDIKKLNSISIGFEGKFDESNYINIVQKYVNTTHHHFYFKEKNFRDLFDSYAFSYDEPFGDYSGFPSIYLSKLAKKYVSVVLSGDGGDEVFGGYPIYQIGTIMEVLYHLPPIILKFFSKIRLRIPFKGISKNFQKFQNICNTCLYKKEDYFTNFSSQISYSPEIFKVWSRKRFYHALKKANWNIAEAFRIFDILFRSLGDGANVKVERASSSTALEVRSPFLDYHIINLSQTIPTKWKVDIRKTKILMREIFKSKLPKEVLRRGKKGFTPPIEEWIFKSDYSKTLNEALLIIKEINSPLYKFYIEKISNNKSPNSNLYKMRLFLFFLWWKKWVK